MFWFVKSVHYYSAGPESKIIMSMLFAYMAGAEGGEGLEVLKCFVRGVRIFSTCCVSVCVCVCVCDGRFSTSPSVKKNTPPPPINK